MEEDSKFDTLGDKRKFRPKSDATRLKEQLQFAKDFNLTFRRPYAEDGAAIWSLVKDTGILDLNSPYSYIMVCHYFSDTCVVAERGGEIVGFLSAFLPPQDDEAVFVWQIAVAESQRGRGVASALLKSLLERPSCAGAHFVTCTVTPSNGASQALFRRLSRDLGCNLEVEEGFPASCFPAGDAPHEPENLFRVGPF